MQKQLYHRVKVIWQHEVILKVPYDQPPNSIWEQVDLGNLDNEVKIGHLIEYHEYREVERFMKEDEGYFLEKDIDEHETL